MGEDLAKDELHVLVLSYTELHKMEKGRVMHGRHIGRDQPRLNHDVTTGVLVRRRVEKSTPPRDAIHAALAGGPEALERTSTIIAVPLFAICFRRKFAEKNIKMRHGDSAIFFIVSALSTYGTIVLD